MQVVCEVQGDLTVIAKRILTTQVREQVLKVITGLRTELMSIDANEEKLRKDAFEREQALKDYQEAQQ